MPVERFRYTDRHTALPGEIVHQPRQIALQMDAERQKVWQHKYLFRARSRQSPHRFIQPGRGFEERRFMQIPRPFRRRARRDRAHRVVGRSHARSVPEYYDPQPHFL